MFDDLHTVKETAHYREVLERLEVISVCKVTSVCYLPLCFLFCNSYNCSLSLFYLLREERVQLEVLFFLFNKDNYLQTFPETDINPCVQILFYFI